MLLFKSTPALPPEALREVFWFATHVPGKLDTTLPGPLQLETERRRTRGLYIDSLRTKLSIVLVCKLWGNIGTEMLYEDVRFGLRRPAGDDIKNLADAFASSKASKSHRKGYGWWTKRVDIGAVNFASPPTVSALCRLLEHCHRLEIFKIYRPLLDSQKEVVSILGKVLSTHFSRSLRWLQCFHRGGPPVSSNRAIYVHPNLETLGMSFSDYPNQVVDKPLAPVTLPKVTSLILHATVFNLAKDLPAWRFPSLKHFSIIDNTEEDFGSLVPFFDDHGSTLRSFCLLQTPEDEHPLDMRDLHLLLDRAPKLKELVFDIVYMGEFTLSRPHSGITHLGLRLADPHYRFDPTDLDLFVTTVASNFPKVVSIRLLDCVQPCNIPFYGSRPEAASGWRAFLQQWSERAIRLEDAEGVEMTENPTVDN